MRTLIKNGVVIDPANGVNSKLNLVIEDGKIKEVTRDEPCCEKVIDAEGKYVAPGFIDTAGNDTWFDSFPDPEAERRRTIDLHPVKRIGTVEEVGALCVYLASPYARFISGTTILMDGGRSALMQDE